MRIIELRATNVKKLRAVAIKPDGNIVIIGGANGSGKTSCLDSIWYALGGKDAFPERPVRDGQDEAIITLDLGEYVVTRKITADGKSSLKLTGKEGTSLSSPQAILDKMIGDLTFDPLEFSRMHPAKQVEQLKKILKLDFSADDQRRARIFEERTHIGREQTSLHGHFSAMRHFEDAPAAEVDISALAGELKAVQARNRENAGMREELTQAVSSLTGWNDEVERLQTELSAARMQVEQWEAKVETYERRGHSGAPADQDESAILSRITGAEETNRKVRSNLDRAKTSDSLKAKNAAYDAATAQLKAIDKKKADAIASAKFPVDGLSFNDSGVLIDGIPFTQASSAEQLRMSVAMGIALNPSLKVMTVRDGSLLDANSMKMLADMAETSDMQIFIERVGDADQSAIIIEDGIVKSHAKA